MNRFNFWNLQRFDEPAAAATTTTEDPSKNGEPSKPEEGAKTEVETVDIKDPKTGDIVKVPKEVQGLVQNIIGVAKSTAKAGADKKVKDIQDRLDGLTKKVGGGGEGPSYDDLQKMLTEIQEKDLPEAEKIKKEQDRRLTTAASSLKFQTEKANVFRHKFESKEINQSIIDALTGHDLHNLTKTVRNIVAESNIRVDWEADSQGNETGNHKLIVEMMLPDESGEMTMQETSLKEGVSKWLNLAGNANELKANLLSGTGTSPTSGSRKDSTGQLLFKKSEIGGIGAPRRKEYSEAIEKKLPHKIIDG